MWPWKQDCGNQHFPFRLTQDVYKRQVYTFDVTGTERTGSDLTTLGANNGLVSSTIKGTEITLNVPYSYVDGDAFFLDYTVAPGAALAANDNISFEMCIRDRPITVLRISTIPGMILSSHPLSIPARPCISASCPALRETA